MIRNSQLTIRPAKELDHSRLVNLIHFETHVHRHLDWLAPLDWIDQSPFIVAEQDGHIEGVLACPQDPPGVAWVRLFGVSGDKDPLKLWQALWPEVLAHLQHDGDPTIAVLPLQEWFIDMLLQEGFLPTTRVVFLMWANEHKLPELKTPAIIIRPMHLEDIPAVAEVDAQAFAPLWRNSDISLRAAFTQAAIATVVEDSQGVVGYQISTASPLGGHLARLAVLPRAQGQHIGSALLIYLLRQFEERGVSRVSVNTQENNPISLHLYQRYGFHLTEEAYPVLEYPG
jgi:ribosomal protein S18 acetylase RimI-like enzyme